MSVHDWRSGRCSCPRSSLNWNAPLWQRRHNWLMSPCFACWIRCLPKSVLRRPVEQALAEQKQRPLRLRLPPLDVPFAQALASAEILIEADARLQPGQCRIESPLGIDDAGLDVRLDALRTAFLQGLASAGAAQ